MKGRLKIFFFVILFNLSTGIKAQIDCEQAMKTGRNALCLEDYKTALYYFDQVIDAKPYLADPYYYRALTRYYLNDHKGAEEDCSACIKCNPFVTNAYQLRGEIRQQSENFDGAKEDYKHALKEIPDNKFLLVNLGIVNIRLKSYEEAKKYLNKVIQIYPKYKGGYTAMASLYLAMQDSVQALNYYKKTVETNKYDSQSYSTRALFYLKAKKYNEAETDFDKAIQINPEIASNYINRGLARYYNNNLREAMSDYNKALELNPNDSSALFNRALLRAHVGDNNRAILDFGAILKQNPENYTAYYQRALLESSIFDTQGALKDLNKVISKYPNFPGVPFLYDKIKKQIKQKPKKNEKEYIYIRNIEEINRRKVTSKRERKPNDTPLNEMQDLSKNMDKFNTPLMVDSEEKKDGVEAKSELKNYLWKTVRPSKSIYIPNSSLFTVTTHTHKSHDANYYYGLMKAGISLDKLGVFANFDKKFARTHPQEYDNTYKYNIGDMMRTGMPQNNVQIHLMGGTLGSSVSGANLSGGGQKHLSKKTKKILKDVYGRDVDTEKDENK